MLPVKIMPQPDDVTCGPTSLHAIYNYYGDDISLEDVIAQVDYLDEGGTLEVLLGCHALRRDYHVTIYSYNLTIFDPTWFSHPNINLIEKLLAQSRIKTSKKLLKSTAAYIEFLKLGGRVIFEDLTPDILEIYFQSKTPILVGLSATYLYNTMREYTSTTNMSIYDDIKGYPSGHFVVLCGHNRDRKQVVVADPYAKNPVSRDNYYTVNVERLINAIMLSIITYDASLLIIEPNAKARLHHKGK